MRSTKPLALLTVALLTVLLARPASAGPLTIGDFAFDNDDFLFGASFTIFNTSNDPGSLGGPGGTFTDVVVHLFSGTTDVSDIALGPVAAGLAVSTSDFLVPFSFDSAVLSFTFSEPGVTAVTPLTGFDFVGTSHLDSYITFTSVPEPSTLLLTGAGALVAALRRRRR